MSNDIIVIKCGGSVITELSAQFFKALHELQKRGKKVVIVHGGGPVINQLLSRMNIRVEFVDGLRKTTIDVLDVVEMTLAGKVNKQFVTNLSQYGLKAVGLSGCDGKMLLVKPIEFEKLGYVGEVDHVNVDLLITLLNDDYIPVVAPIGMSSQGGKYNINADSAAGSIAEALNAKQLLFVTDVPGILQNGILLEEASENQINGMISDGTIYGGMIPKVKAAIHSLSDKLQEVMIVSGKNSILSASGSLHGTKIRKM
ncbi:acetylglutamate kinase [Bacillus sp. SM2101]|uniref:acetylglutamate kinase n=1 Tax=Bacillus sp. SM2101 TaxID=2805366 RepID=UPI001BDEFEDD|nr:acetylglutamate kinase [Bacillus sp. SM2101]